MLCSVAEMPPITAEPCDAPRMLPMPRVGLIDSKTLSCSINVFWGCISLAYSRAESKRVAALFLRPPLCRYPCQLRCRVLVTPNSHLDPLIGLRAVTDLKRVHFCTAIHDGIGLWRSPASAAEQLQTAHHRLVGGGLPQLRLWRVCRR